MVTRTRSLWRWALSGLGGAVVMIGLGQLFALAGGSCTILCRPAVAGVYGATLGLLLFGSGRRDAGANPSDTGRLPQSKEPTP